MAFKTLPKYTAAVSAFLGLLFFAILLSYFFPKNPVLAVPSNVIQKVTTIPKLILGRENIGLPVRLKIPRIKVDALIEDVGLTPDGAMDVPKGPSNAAWFDLGPRPGETGSAVVAGHYGWKNNIPAAFDNLSELRKGDKIYVVDDKGAVIAFVVRESRTFDQNADASSIFSSRDNKSHLNLITCEGVWDKVKKSYSGRLVVFADRE